MSKAARKLVDAILSGEPSEMISEMARQAIDKKPCKALKRRHGDWMAREDFADGDSGQSGEEMNLGDFFKTITRTWLARSMRAWRS